MRFGERIVEGERLDCGGLCLRDRFLRRERPDVEGEAERQITVCQPAVRSSVAWMLLDRLVEVADGSVDRFFRPLAPEIAALDVQLVGLGIDFASAREAGLFFWCERDSNLPCD